MISSLISSLAKEEKQKKIHTHTHACTRIHTLLRSHSHIAPTEHNHPPFPLTHTPHAHCRHPRWSTRHTRLHPTLLAGTAVWPCVALRALNTGPVMHNLQAACPAHARPPQHRRLGLAQGEFPGSSAAPRFAHSPSSAALSLWRPPSPSTCPGA